MPNFFDRNNWKLKTGCKNRRFWMFCTMRVMRKKTAEAIFFGLFSWFQHFRNGLIQTLADRLFESGKRPEQKAFRPIISALPRVPPLVFFVGEIDHNAGIWPYSTLIQNRCSPAIFFAYLMHDLEVFIIILVPGVVHRLPDKAIPFDCVIPLKKLDFCH